MMVSSERAAAAALPSTSRQMLAAYRTKRDRGFHAAVLTSPSRSPCRSPSCSRCRFAPALVIEPPNVGQDRDDLAVAEHRTERGHGAHLALLDALDDEFVAALGFRQFRTPTRGTTTILVTETAGGGEHLLAIDVVRGGFGV